MGGAEAGRKGEGREVSSFRCLGSRNINPQVNTNVPVARKLNSAGFQPQVAARGAEMITYFLGRQNDVGPSDHQLRSLR